MPTLASPPPSSSIEGVDAAASALRNEALASTNRLELLEFALERLAETVESPRGLALLSLGGPAEICARTGDTGTTDLAGLTIESVERIDEKQDPHVEAILNQIGFPNGLLVPFRHSNPPGAFLLAEPTSGWSSQAIPDLSRLSIVFDLCWAWRDAHDRFQQVVSDLDDSLFAFTIEDDGRRYSLVTPQIGELTGIEAGKWLSAHAPPTLTEIASPQYHQLLDAHNERLAGGQKSTVDFEIDIPTYGSRWIRERAAPVIDAAGRVAISGILSDISAEKVAEAKLIEAKKTAEHAAQVRMNFLTTMSHELRTPLGVIDGFGMLLEEELGEAPASSTTEFIGAIRANTKRALDLVSRLFELSRAETRALPISRMRFDLGELTLRVLGSRRNAIEAAGIEVSVSAIPEMAACVADPGRVEQILTHLLDNACEHSGSSTLSVKLYSKRKAWALEVSDSGKGIAKDRQEAIFEPFGHADSSLAKASSSTTFGLPLSRRLARLMKGELAVESESEKGCRFILSLPRAD